MKDEKYVFYLSCLLLAFCRGGVSGVGGVGGERWTSRSGMVKEVEVGGWKVGVDVEGGEERMEKYGGDVS